LYIYRPVPLISRNQTILLAELRVRLLVCDKSLILLIIDIIVELLVLNRAGIIALLIT
jgi:hypothetical protein